MTTMRVIVNRNSGTRHLPGDDARTLCGHNLVGLYGTDNGTTAEVDDDPDTFGDHDRDCSDCARLSRRDDAAPRVTDE